MSERRWTHQTAEKVARCLNDGLEVNVSATVVRRLLKNLDYSLKSNKKCLSSGNSPDRDLQFGIIKRLREEFAETGNPIISVDTKKKELIGLFKNPGQIWCSDPTEVNDHDFRSEAEGLAAPYGIYDLLRNFGVLVVGTSADTPEFAVNSISLWWDKHGQVDYPNSKRLLILADSGGSNGARPRMWKKMLQERLADPYGVAVTVAHYPTGASKWNPIEHRMFSTITKNWAGKPLVSFDALVNFVSRTKTKTGLRLEAYLDKRVYEKGKKVSDKEMNDIALTKGDELEKWNYTIEPSRADDPRPFEVKPKPALPRKRSASQPTARTMPQDDKDSMRGRGDDNKAHQRATEKATTTRTQGPLGAAKENLPPHTNSSRRPPPGGGRQRGNSTGRTPYTWTPSLTLLITGFRRLFSSSSSC